MSAAELRVLKGVHGTNKVHWLGATRPQGVAVLFGGDHVVSAPPEVLRLQDAKEQAELVCKKWPGCSVVVVAPSRHEAGFSCYDHFLEAYTRSGEPLGYKGTALKACLQTWSLLRSLGLPAPCARAQWPPVRLLGFSKGSVVVNQVLAEVAYLEGLPEEAAAAQLRRKCTAGADVDPQDVLAFLMAIREVLLLDAGLNCRGAHLTDPEAAAGLGRWCRRAPLSCVSLHGTPRQWGCPARPWITDEKDRCASLLAAAGVPVKQQLHFAGEEPSLLMHFRVLEAFTFCSVDDVCSDVQWQR